MSRLRFAEARFYRDVDKAFPQMLRWIARHRDQVAGLGSALHSLMEEGEKHRTAYNELVLVHGWSSVIYWLLQEADDGQQGRFFSVMYAILEANADAGESALYRAFLCIKPASKQSQNVMPFSIDE